MICIAFPTLIIKYKPIPTNPSPSESVVQGQIERYQRLHRDLDADLHKYEKDAFEVSQTCQRQCLLLQRHLDSVRAEIERCGISPMDQLIPRSPPPLSEVQKDMRDMAR